MPLLRHAVFAHEEQLDDARGELLRRHYTLTVKHDLGDQLAIGNHHRHGSEQRFEVVGQIATTRVSGIHGDEGGHVLVQLDASPEQVDVGRVVEQPLLDAENLLTHGAQDTFLETIELVEAAPGADLTETGENSSHCAEIEGFIAVENEDESPELRSERLHRFGFSGTRRTEGRSSHAEVQSLRERQVSLVGKRGLHQTFADSQVLESVIEVRIGERDLQFLREFRRIGIVGVPQMVQPFEIRGARNPLLHEIADDIPLMNELSDHLLELLAVVRR
mmetsp:Transcript_1997/g.5250  ORF Transcript_1997/g.5250 Transcript_1997/m.5250 type:complete len:276 (-) Transcript_1997:2227-3054(-)